MKLIIYLTILMVLFSNQLFSQIIITDLSENTSIMKESQKYNEKTIISNDTLRLPFLDDFSASNIFPNQNLWKDKNVFINGDYPINPYTINVATFDALDSTGSIYVNALILPFKADYMTSKPIKLDSVGSPIHLTTVTDSIYFSFYYQPQGIGNAPEKNDSLVLEFYDKVLDKWNRVWYDTGSTYQNFYSRYHTSFKRVIILIDSVKYFTDAFQFRFYNCASLSNQTLISKRSNCDQWHIDYVYLNYNRSRTDTTYKDLAISKQGTSLLKSYNAMPWRQFKVNAANEMSNNTDITICNLDNQEHSCTFYYKIFENNIVVSSSDTAANIPNITPFLFYNPPMTVSSNAFPINNNDNALFIVKKIIKDQVGNVIKSNDTVSFYQDFNNYYAYDDGNPEAGIGLSPANSKLALKFTLNTPDTLRAVQIYFNATPNNANQKYFKLMVWKSIYPEVILATKTGLKPVFGEDYNRYHYYRLDDPLVVSDTFYVGVQQTTEDYLNIGFDYNNDSKDKAFYNTSAKWLSVPYSGAIMMRPVLGSVIPPNASINEVTNTFTNISVYPNPVANNILYIEIPDVPDKNKVQMQFFDIYGRLLFTNIYSNTLNISTYSNGLYFIRLINTDTKEAYTSKVLISK